MVHHVSNGSASTARIMETPGLPRPGLTPTETIKSNQRVKPGVVHTTASYIHLHEASLSICTFWNFTAVFCSFMSARQIANVPPKFIFS